MDTSLIVLLSVFLLIYAFYVTIQIIDKLYWICDDLNEKDKEEKENEKNKNIPESCKHIYS